MRVNFLINSIGAGGAEKQLLIVAGILADNGFDCHVWTLERRELSISLAYLKNLCTNSGVQFHIPAFSKLARAHHLLRFGKHVLHSRNEVFWSWGNRADSLCKLMNRRSCGNQILCSLRLASEKAIKKKIGNFRWRGDRVDAYISNSSLNVRILRKYLNIPSKKFFVLPNAILPDRDTVNYFPRSREDVKKRLRVALLGNNRTWHKGYDTLFNVAEAAKLQGKSMLFTIAGIDYEGNLAAEIDGRGLGDVVNYSGPTNVPARYLIEHDVFLLTSRVEGMPNALLEAMSLGMPAVATRVGDLDELFGSKDCLSLCDIEDEEAILESLERYQQDWNVALRIGSRAQRVVEETLSRSTIEKQVLRIFSTLCGTDAT